MKNIKNIIFDLGRVLEELDDSLRTKEFARLGVPDFYEFFAQAPQNKLYDDFESGRISAETFCLELQKVLPRKVSLEKVIRAWNVMLSGIPHERIEMLKKLRKRYQLFLLSNTNSLHIDYINKKLKQQHKIDNLELLFNSTYYSYKIGINKPSLQIFKVILLENNLAPQETLFVDDILENITAAQQLGIHALHLTPDLTVIDLLTNAGILK